MLQKYYTMLCLEAGSWKLIANNEICCWPGILTTSRLCVVVGGDTNNGCAETYADAGATYAQHCFLREACE